MPEPEKKQYPLWQWVVGGILALIGIANFFDIIDIPTIVREFLGRRPIPQQREYEQVQQQEYEQVEHTPSADELREMQKCKQMVQRDKVRGRYKVGDYWVPWPCDNFGKPFPENDYGLPYDPQVPGDKNGMMAGYDGHDHKKLAAMQAKLLGAVQPGAPIPVEKPEKRSGDF